MTFRDKMEAVTRRLFMTEFDDDDCSPPYVPTQRRSRQYVSSPVSFVTVTKLTAAAEADTPLVCPVPFKWIMVVSTRQADINDTLYLHFTPLNKSYTTTGIFLVGNENWLPLCSSTGNHSKIGMGYIFEEEMPPTTLYLDIGQEAGGAGGVPITFALSRSMRYWNLINQS